MIQKTSVLSEVLYIVKFKRCFFVSLLFDLICLQSLQIIEDCRESEIKEARRCLKQFLGLMTRKEIKYHLEFDIPEQLKSTTSDRSKCAIFLRNMRKAGLNNQASCHTEKDVMMIF